MGVKEGHNGSFPLLWEEKDQQLAKGVKIPESGLAVGGKGGRRK